jgi:hypothetical protein
MRIQYIHKGGYGYKFNRSKIVEIIGYTERHVEHQSEHDSREYYAASYEYRVQ